MLGFQRLLLTITQEPLRILVVTFAFTQVHLNEALDDRRIKYGYLSTLLMQTIGQGQIIGTCGFHYKLAVCPTGSYQLLESGFIITDSQVLDLVVYLVTDSERGFTHVNADNGKRGEGFHNGSK